MGRLFLLNTGKEQEAGGTPSYASHRFVVPGLAPVRRILFQTSPVSFRQRAARSVRLVWLRSCKSRLLYVTTRIYNMSVPVSQGPDTRGAAIAILTIAD